MFGELKKRLPKSNKSSESNCEKKSRNFELERGDLSAMIIAAFLTIVLPIGIMMLVIFGILYLFFVR